ncbi:hypothetical protein EVAR_62349_1 [Eumeta japonica]|uniref:Uncharacterized protein n=1 Tax=Eumeta variegata TaxID=151549 RepID=A0A4C1ZQ56_EUMVA|nr:hypothetical protein EVAR_62349_1 [Eumeta japonica]
MLPYFKEIEAKPVRATKKTVNLNFSLPKEIAEYLYQTKNKDSFDKLQILNLGMHNYLVLTNDNVLTNSASTKFIPLGKLIYEESSRIPTNIDDEQELFPNNNSYMVEEEYQDINNDDLTDITNKISDLTSSQFSENETPSKELRAQTSSSKENNATNILFHTKNANTNHFPSNLIHKQLYSGELYNYPVPDVSQLILGEENLIKQEFTKNGQQHTEVLNLQENTFQTPQILEDKSSVETEVTKLDNQFISNGFPSKFQVVPKSNIEFNNTKTNSYDPVHYHDSLKSTEMEGNVLKTKSNIIHGTSLDKLNIKEKTNDGFSESELYKINNSLRSATGREIEIRLIPSISWHIEKEEDIKELLHLIKTKDMGQHRNNFLNKDEPHNEDQINYFNSEIDYTVDHSLTRDKDKDNYKVSGGTYTGPSSYLVSQSSIGSLEPYRDQLMKPNVTLGYNNYKPARIEDLDDRNGYQKVSPLPPFTF